MASTKNPSGLAISRINMKFIFSWKIADNDYGAGQELQWRMNLDKAGTWRTETIGRASVQKSVSLTAADYYPTTSAHLKEITFRVRGKKTATTDSKTGKVTTYDWSAWVSKSFTMDAPARPSVTAELDSELDNVTTFSWEVETENDDSRPFALTEYQSMLVRICNETDGSKLSWKSTAQGWQTGTGSATGQISPVEDTAMLANDSYTRWFRVRSRGCYGDSAWRYAKHVYAKPYKPVIEGARASIVQGVTTVKVSWNAEANAAHPIDRTSVEYILTTPAANMACPVSANNWETVNISRDTSGRDSARFTFTGAPGTDECLYVHVGATHDHDPNTTYSDPRLVAVGRLATPENLSVTTDDTTYRATVSATNASEVPDSKLAILYRVKGQEDIIVGIISGSDPVTVQCPNWSGVSAKSFGVYAFQGTYTKKTRSDNVNTYVVKANMTSPTLWRGGAVPVAPDEVTAESTETQGEALLTWAWKWTQANQAEISWSTNPNAWESTDEPSSYILNNTHAARWRVSGLSIGVTWYFRVRLLQVAEGETTAGPWSDVVALDLSSAPVKPVLSVPDSIVLAKGSVRATWAYISTDGTAQSYAEIRECTVVDGEVTRYGKELAHTTTAQSVTISAKKWATGSTHYFAVRVTSESGHVSEWSDPVSVTVATPITITLASTSLTNVTIDSESIRSLVALPLSAVVNGAGQSGTTTLVIERESDYHIVRPDGERMDGYAGETIAQVSIQGEGSIAIGLADLIGRLDDGAQYRMIATAEDELGQSASVSVTFEVHWTHQAEVPDAEVEMIDGIAVITPIAPEGFATGDVCDIYRLTADLPELIVQNGTFGTTYADPYPAIGTGYGHRVVHRTVNGDYITAGNQPAWIDLTDEDGDLLEEYSIIVDFDGNQLILPYDMSLSNRWAKDFRRTDYLGGAQQGDWNPAVSRTATYTFNLIADDDADTIQGLRELAAYSGICHIRTPEGSSYSADIQVSEAKSYSDWDLVSYTLTVSKVDPEELDGVVYELE